MHDDANSLKYKHLKEILFDLREGFEVLKDLAIAIAAIFIIILAVPCSKIDKFLLRKQTSSYLTHRKVNKQTSILLRSSNQQIKRREKLFNSIAIINKQKYSFIALVGTFCLIIASFSILPTADWAKNKDTENNLKTDLLK